MKKTIAIILALVTILALAGCGVTTRQYRRYSTPATDYTLDGTVDGNLTDGSYAPYTGTPRRTYTGRATTDAYTGSRPRYLDPAGASLHDGTINRTGTQTQIHTGTRADTDINNTTLNDKMSRAAS